MALLIVAAQRVTTSRSLSYRWGSTAFVDELSIEQSEKIMTTEPTILEVSNANGVGLRVTFEWHRDRYRQLIECIHQQQSQLVLSSLEGSSDDDWPPSPPFQQLSLEGSCDDQQTLFLVGMAGKSHWSGSVEVRQESSQIIFDVACRCHGFPQFLGSVYTNDSVESEIGDDNTALLTTATGAVRLQLEPTAGDDPECRLSIGRQITIQRPNSSSSVPCTLRWKYCLRV